MYQNSSDELEFDLEDKPVASAEISQSSPAANDNHALAVPIPQQPWLQLWHGMWTLPRAIWLVHRFQLWGLAMMPLLLNAILLGGLLLLGWLVLVPWVAWKLLAWQQALPQVLQYYPWLWRLLVGVLCLTLLPLVTVVSMLVVACLGQFIAYPYLEQLSEVVECLYFNRPLPSRRSWLRWFSGLFWALGELFWSLCLPVLVFLPYVLGCLLPVFGPLISLLSGSFWLGFVFLGFPMARHLQSFRARIVLLLRHPLPCLGLGGSIFLLFMIPGFNILALPFAAVAGTLLYCDFRTASWLSPPDY